MKCSIVREIDSLDRLVRSGANLNCTVIQGLDLREANLPWKALNCNGAVFLGCRFPAEVSVCDLIDKGALIFRISAIFHIILIDPNSTPGRSS